MGWTRGSLALPRMNAHRLVVSAAALTTMVAAALATALATFSGQGLPGAVRHDLTGASGTSIVISGAVNAGQVAQYTAQLGRSRGRCTARPTPSTGPGGPTRSGSCPAPSPRLRRARETC